jgi:hypothetical protein
MAGEVIEQLRAQLPQAAAKAGKLTDWGARYEVRAEVVGSQRGLVVRGVEA